MSIWTDQLKTKSLYAIAVGTFCVLIATGWVSYNAISLLVENESRVSQTKSILRAITNTFSEIQGIELGFRAFLVTGKEGYLEPFQSGSISLESKLTLLKSLKSEDQVQQQRLEQLSRLIQERMVDIGQVVARIENLYEAKLALNQELLNDDKKLQKIRQLVRTMEDREYVLLRDQAQQVKTAREQVFVSITVAIVIALLILAASFWVFYRILNKQEEENQCLETKVGQRTAELQHLLSELKRSNQDLEDFAFVASHDLQEPLRKIRTFSDRLASKYGDVLGDGVDYLNRLQSASTRMSKLIEDLLEFSRVSTRARPFAKVDLGGVFNEVVENLEIAIEDSGTDIQLGSLPVIEGDSVQLGQVFQNILSNAIKFVPADRAPKIEVASSAISPLNHPLIKGSMWYEITIKDNGIGFEEKYLNKIFTPFKRLHSRSKYAGTGIGLAVCKKIVDRHGGEITADSQPDIGTTFRVRLPASQATDAEFDLNQLNTSEEK